MKIGGLQKISLIDFPKHIACVIFTIGCNFRCPYCHNPELVDETAEQISEKEIFDFLKKRTETLEGVVITGGEPTMHDDLPIFISKIKKLGYKIKLDSNGTRPEMLRQLLKEKQIDYIAMDIKSPLNTYGYSVGRPVNTKKIKESINLIKKSGIQYEFRTTVVKSLLKPEDIVQIGKEIKGADKYYLQKFIPTKILNPQFKKKVSYTDEEFRELKRELSKYVKECQIR